MLAEANAGGSWEPKTQAEGNRVLNHETYSLGSRRGLL
jgi:hypothetical protein